MNAIERLRASSRPRLVAATHGFGGGVERHVRELAAAVAHRVHVLELAPAAGETLALRELGDADGLALWIPRDDWAGLVETLSAIGIDRLHVHHVHGFPEAILELAIALGCPCDVTLHDYFPACPEYHLFGGGRYCGGRPDCQRCTLEGPAQWGLGIDAWRARLGTWLRAADRVIAPSEDVARRMRTFFPAIDIAVWPHQASGSPVPARAARVLVPGAISPAKGVALLEACVRDAAQRELPLHFRVLGYLSHPIPQWPALPLSLSGEYPEGTLPVLLAHEGGDVAFFPAQCPETYSYTLGDAIAAGLPIVATDLGALPERLRGVSHARVLRWDAPPAEFNDALLAAAGRAVEARAVQASTVAAYIDRYLAPFPARARGPRGAVPAIDACRQQAPQQSDPPTTTLAWLYRDAILCGRGLSRDKLARRTAEADARLAQLEAELARLREQSDAAPTSRTWRVPAPLRRLASRWRRARS